MCYPLGSGKSLPSISVEGAGIGTVRKCECLYLIWWVHKPTALTKHFLPPALEAAHRVLRFMVSKCSANLPCIYRISFCFLCSWLSFPAWTFLCHAVVTQYRFTCIILQTHWSQNLCFLCLAYILLDKLCTQLSSSLNMPEATVNDGKEEKWMKTASFEQKQITVTTVTPSVGSIICRWGNRLREGKCLS